MPALLRHPITDLFDLLGRRWALRVLWELREAPLTYGELRTACDEVSTSVLAQRLRELTEARLLAGDGDGAYVLTATGAELLALLAPVNDWARRWGRAVRR